MRQKQNGLTRNKWKWLFLLLLACNLAFVGVLASRLVQPREVATPKQVASQTKDIKIGSLVTTREELNQALTSYLSSYQTKQMRYAVYLTPKAILFEGSYQLFGAQVPLYVYFQPYQLENGSLQLTVTSVSAGTLPLPIKDVLNYMKSSYQLPKLVKISPKEHTITLNLQALENEQGIYLKATSFDLVNDKISFDLMKKSQD